MRNTDNNMDTVILEINTGYTIAHNATFFPEFRKRTYGDLSPAERAYKLPSIHCYRLQTKKTDRYLPKVKMIERHAVRRGVLCYVLKIEFSAPKLLYWNSLQEVSEKDEEALFKALQSALASIGIEMPLETIAHAKVTAVHVCKNVPLPETFKMREIVSTLAKMNITKAYDASEKQCKNGGRLLNIYSGTKEHSFYDKISDSMRTKNKRRDKEYIDKEREIVLKYGLQRREVFRYEYRIKGSQTVRSQINAIIGREYEVPVEFKDLFIPNLLKTIILTSWDALIRLPENQLLLFETIDPLKLLLYILEEATKINRTGHSINKAFISYGLILAIQQHGLKEVRGSVFDLWNDDHPERLTEKLTRAAELVAGLPRSKSILHVDTELKRFKLITLSILENGI